MKTFSLSDFDYPLPPERIAQAPLATRSASRLLVLPSGEAPLIDSTFSSLPQFLKPGDLLIFNDTRVLHARFYGEKESGGRIELLIERTLGEHEALAMIRASKPPKPGSLLWLAERAFSVEVLGRVGEFFHIRFPRQQDMFALIEFYGKLPLPPYIERAAEQSDEARYQTVYARHLGSVAAPTAGLHFDETLLATLTQQGVNLAWVTLHVGAGTFQPVRVENLAEHVMHKERFFIPPATVEAIQATRQKGGRVIAVGTTSLRALEAAAQSNSSLVPEGEAALFITPGYTFKVIDGLITNFHLPKSTLLMLVSALAGFGRIRNAYAHAIEAEYRFFSYGDAMFIMPQAR